MYHPPTALALHTTLHILSNMEDATFTNLINRYNTSHDQNLELEVRLGEFDNKKFTSGVRKADFYRMMDFYARTFECTQTFTTQETNGKYRIEANRVITKEMTDKLDDHGYGIRIAISKESPHHGNIMDSGSIRRMTSCTRKKRRTSYNIHNSLRLDFTKVSSTEGDLPDEPKITYEIELEILRKPIDARFVHHHIQSLIQYWQDTFFIMTKAEKQQALADLAANMKCENVSRFAGAQPRTFQIEHFTLLNDIPYALTRKLDGHRAYLMISKRNVYLLNHNGATSFHIKQIAALKNNDMDGTLVDGEMSTIFYAFDVIAWKDEDLRNNPAYAKLKDRLKLLDDLTKALPDRLISLKTYHFGSGDEIYKHVKRMVTERDPDQDYATDGLVFVPAEEMYPKSRFWPNLLKWKPQITIDFRIRKDKLYVKAMSGEIVFRPESHPAAGTIHAGLINFKYSDGDICECYWEPTTDSFVPIYHRPDKKYPNFIAIALDNFRAIHTPVTTHMLFGEEYIPDVGISTSMRNEKYIVNTSELVQMAVNEVESDTEDMDFPVCKADVITQTPIIVDPAPLAVPEKIPLSFDCEDINWGDSEMDPPPPPQPPADDDHDMMSDEDTTNDAGDAQTPSSLPDVSDAAVSNNDVLLGQPIRIWRLASLRDECKNRGLDKKGKKGDLINRLKVWESTHDAV
jgi:hypothetical protein